MGNKFVKGSILQKQAIVCYSSCCYFNFCSWLHNTGRSAAAIRGNSFKNGGTNGVGFVRLDAKGGTTDWITASKASGAAAGLVGSAYIIYIPVS